MIKQTLYGLLLFTLWLPVQGCKFPFFNTEAAKKKAVAFNEEFPVEPTYPTEPSEPTQAQFQLSISPKQVTLLPAETVSFSAVVTGNGAKLVWSVEEGTAGGTISKSGMYTAPVQQGTYRISVRFEGTDVVASATVTVEQCFPSSFTLYSSPGSDETWRTADDVGMYTVQHERSDGLVQKIIYWEPGADSLIGTEDDQVFSWHAIEYGLLDGSVRAVRELHYDAAGDDELWFTDDDVLSYFMTYAESTNVSRYSVYVSAGVDAAWFTDDDELDQQRLFWEDAAFHLYESGARTVPGPDGVYDTSDDEWRKTYGIEFFDSAGRKIRFVQAYDAGADNQWGTSDDLTLEERRFRYTPTTTPTIWGAWDWSNGRRFETDYDEIVDPGADTIWGTDDDYVEKWSRSVLNGPFIEVTKYEWNYDLAQAEVVSFVELLVDDRGFATDTIFWPDGRLDTEVEESIRVTAGPMVCGVQPYIDPGLYSEQ